MIEENRQTSMNTLSLKVCSSSRKSIKGIQKYCQDEEDLEILKKVFTTDNELMYECMDKMKKGKIVQPKYNPCINYGSYCDSMIRELNNNLESLKLISLYYNLYQGLSIDERQKIQCIDNNIKYHNIRRSRAKKHTLDRSMECPFMKCCKCYASRTALKLHIKRCHDLKEPVKKNLKFSLISIVSSTSTKGVNFDKVIKKKISKEDNVINLEHSVNKNNGEDSNLCTETCTKNIVLDDGSLGKRKSVNCEIIDNLSQNDSDILDPKIIEKNNKIKYLNCAKKNSSKKKVKTFSRANTSKSVQRFSISNSKSNFKTLESKSFGAKNTDTKNKLNTKRKFTIRRTSFDVENEFYPINDCFTSLHSIDVVNINDNNVLAEKKATLSEYHSEDSISNMQRINKNELEFLNDNNSLLNSEQNHEHFENKICHQDDA